MTVFHNAPLVFSDFYAIDKTLGVAAGKGVRCPYIVTAGDFKFRMSQFVKQIAVVGKQQQPAALQIQTSDVFHGAKGRGQIVVNGRASLRIVSRADAACGFVKKDDFGFGRRLDFPPVHSHVVGFGNGKARLV